METVTAATARPTSDPATSRLATPLKRTAAPAARDDSSRARRRHRILYIFSGPRRPLDGFAAMATTAGFDTTELDLEHGGEEHDMGDQANRARVLLDLRAGEYCAVLVATPCKTFSIARGNHPEGTKLFGLRSPRFPSGPPWLDAATRALVDEHDRLVAFSAEVLSVALDLDIDFVLENPAPRNDTSLASSWPERAHLLQIWDTTPLRLFRARAGARAELLVVPQCAFGPTPSGKVFQKYTGLLCSRRVAGRLADLRFLTCNHARHDEVACGENGPLAAAYPAALNDALAFGLTGVRRTTPLPRPPPHASSPPPLPPPPPPLAPPSPPAEAAPAATPQRAASPAPPDSIEPPRLGPDRSINTGYITDGPSLSAPVRAAVEDARTRRRKWASFANLEPASTDELRAAPMPNLLPQAGRTEWPGPPSQPGADERLAEFRATLGRNIAITDLWLPEEWRRFQAWMAKARRGVSQKSAIFPQSSLQPLARGFVWDTRNPDDCIPMQPSDEHTRFPGKRQINREAFCRMAAEVGSRDADILGQVGRGGVESRSRCELTSELHSHAPGLCARPEAAAAAVDKELEEEWALGPFTLPPTVPIRALPRDVIEQQRSRVLEGGVVEDYLKDRITLNPSRGSDSVNAGIPKCEREVSLTTARDLGYTLAVIDVPARDAGCGVAGYGVDMTSAYSFLLVQRLDWWQFAYIWFDEDGAAHFRLLIRVGFGGAMSPRRFQSVSVIITAYARMLQARFDALNPPPPEVLRWVREREGLQRRGALPPGADQRTPSAAGVYIDDLAGGCCDDEVEVPPILYGVDTAAVDLGELSAFAAGGQPLRRSSRPAAHCFCAIAAVRRAGLEETPGKTEGGDVFVNLGLRLSLREGRIDCPGPKRRILLRDLGLWHERVEAARPFERAMAHKQVGRIGNLTQVLPELLTHISAGYAASNAGYRPAGGGRRRLVSSVPLKRGSTLHSGLSQLLPHAIAVVERNEGVPLAPRAAFASLDEPGVLLLVSDASGHDGFGGWAFAGPHDSSPAVLSEPWPDDMREALRQYKLPAAQRAPGAPLLSMPAAELFTAVALAAAAAALKPHTAVIAVGDCDPAARALDAASSGTPQMDALLAAARRRVKQWLGVAIPREWNLDADRLSHPAQLDAVLSDARAAGLSPRVVSTPDECWVSLRAASRLATLDDQ